MNILIDTKYIQLILCIFQIKQIKLTVVTEKKKIKGASSFDFGTLQERLSLPAVLLCVLLGFAIILKRTSELIGLLLFSYGCLVTVNVL